MRTAFNSQTAKKLVIAALLSVAMTSFLALPSLAGGMASAAVKCNSKSPYPIKNGSNCSKSPLHSGNKSKPKSKPKASSHKSTPSRPAGPDSSVTGLPNVSAGTPALKTIINIVIGIVAALSVLFIVIGGLRFVLAGDDTQAVSKAKGTVAYALVGLLIAVLAEALVALVLSKLS